MILIIDDSTIMQELLQLMLTAAGYDVTSALDGEEGLVQFQTHQAAIRLIILDLQMPKVDGFTTLRRLRLLDNTVPIILFTAMDYDEVYPLVPPSSAVSILEKFCGRRVLLSTIQQLIRD